MCNLCSVGAGASASTDAAAPGGPGPLAYQTLLNPYGARQNKGEPFGTPAVVTYSFAGPDDFPGRLSGYRPVKHYSVMSSQVREEVRVALDEYERRTGVTFIEAPDDGKLSFMTAFGADGYSWAEFPTDASTQNVVINRAVIQAGIHPGERGYPILLHEIGHAMGLKHPFDNRPTLAARFDNYDYTVMSYTTGTHGVRKLGPLDVDALDHYYGDPVHYAFEIEGISQRTGALILADDNAGHLVAFEGFALDVIGRGGDDTLIGSPDADTLDGGNGDDVIRANGGDDTAIGSVGDDRIEGGGGEDSLDGGRGRDTLAGGSGSDTADGGASHDRIDGAAGDDVLHGGKGDDTISGGRGADRLLGGEGHDWFGGSGGADTIDGGKGSDTLEGDAGGDRLLGGESGDQLSGGAGNDTLSGDAGRDSLLGGDGRDSLTGGAAGDTLRGENDPDVVGGGNGDDLIAGGQGNDDLSANAGRDTLFGGDGADDMSGGSGADFLIGGPGRDQLIGGTGGDTLEGKNGADVLSGERGNDVLKSGTDRAGDTLDGGAGCDDLFANTNGRASDTIVFADDYGRDHVFGFTASDLLDIDVTGFSRADLLALANQVGDNVTFDFADAERLVLHDVSVSLITDAIFV